MRSSALQNEAAVAFLAALPNYPGNGVQYRPMTTKKQKLSRSPLGGRPPIAANGEIGERYQVRIPPSVEARIRKLGGGSLSQGIVKLAMRKVMTA